MEEIGGKIERGCSAKTLALNLKSIACADSAECGKHARDFMAKGKQGFEHDRGGESGTRRLVDTSGHGWG